ncbi:MAG: DNA mismatch repair protein MutS [Pseudomonadota bacterium]
MSDQEAEYRAREQRFNAEAERHAARSRTVSNLRGLSFAVFIVSLLLSVFGKSNALAGPISLLGLAAFLALVVWHSRVLVEEDLARRFARVNKDALARTTGRFSELAENGARFVDPTHPYTSDLDVFGPSSLFQRVSVAHTRVGQEKLSGFFSHTSPPTVVRERQVAVRALSPLLDLRQRIEALALGIVDPGSKRKEPPNPEPLLLWAEEKPQLKHWLHVVWAARILPFFTIGGMVLWSSFGRSWLFFTVPAVLSMFTLSLANAITSRVFHAVSETQGAFLRYGTLLGELESLDVDAPLIRAAQARLTQSGKKPSEEMRRFERVVGFFELKHNGMIYPVVNLFLLWDVHCVLALEAWQERAGRFVREWLDVVGEAEALSSLAGLAHDEPNFCFAEFSDRPCFLAEELGHVLIDRQVRVTNSVSLPEAGTALLVTGSNMSGKSTLLRSMGLANVLAFAGGPVCAKRLVLAEFALITSIRISDSLASGVSHFYAELNKLKAVVDGTAGDKPVFFLLDEILHGTNSLERQIGARWVIGELIKRGALGAVSTHDMGLAELEPALMSRVTLIHFRESVKDNEMSFDYKAHPGPVQAGNALRLMRRIGLDVPLD